MKRSIFEIHAVINHSEIHWAVYRDGALLAANHESAGYNSGITQVIANSLRQEETLAVLKKIEGENATADNA